MYKMLGEKIGVNMILSRERITIFVNDSQFCGKLKCKINIQQVENSVDNGKSS